MYVVEADIRNPKDKARRLRKEGITPCCIYGSDIDQSILIQIPEGDTQKLIREKDIGGRVSINCDGKTYNALIKDLTTDILTNKVTHIGFQNIKKGEVVNSEAQISYINMNNPDLLVLQLMDEIPYRAKTEDLIEDVVIDLSGINEPKEYMLSELDIYKNDAIDITLDEDDAIVLNIVYNVGETISDSTEDEDEDYIPPTVAETEEKED